MNHAKSLYLLFCLFAVMLFASQFFVSKALAADSSITGFAWAGNNNDGGDPSTEPSSIGWISFSSKNCDKNGDGTITVLDNAPAGCPAVGTTVGSYGVKIHDNGDGTATLSGDAWSDSVGWISFDPGVNFTTCPTAPCEAKMDIATGKLTGWARVISTCKDDQWDTTNKKCKSALAGDAAGGWDGWIHLAGSNYGVVIDPNTGKFSGYASSAADQTTGTIGWIEFTGQNVHTDFLFPTPVVTTPVAQMYCNASGCDDSSNATKKVYCDCNASGNCVDPNSTWVMYQPTNSPACTFLLKNNSTGTFDQSIWKFDASHIYPCAAGTPKCDTTVPNIGTGTFTVTLDVSNGGVQGTPATHLLKILQDAHAGFMCSMNGKDGTWVECSKIANMVPKGSLVYFADFRDTPSLATGDNYSWPSSGENIVKSDWTLNGTDNINPPVDPLSPASIDTNAKITSHTLDEKNDTVTLTILDSNGRTSSQTFDFKTNSLPKWKEISPDGTIWKNMLAGIFSLFNGVGR